MLADDILAASGSPMDGMLRGAFAKLGGLIQGAHRFDLSPEVICRFPFARCWFEWPATFSGRAPRKRELEAPVPKRMGALAQCDPSLQRGLITYAWSHPEGDDMGGGPNICPLSVTFDWREHPEPVRDMANSATWHERATEEDWRHMRATYPRIGASTRDDLIAENQRFGMVFSPMLREFIGQALMSGDRFRQYLDAAALDVEGEPPLLRAALMLMNSKNLARTEARTPSAKLNAARVKRRQRPLLDHTHVTIQLSKGLAARAGAADDTRQPHRLHLVRGHFKVRASGVWWWSPHPRGRGPGQPIREQTRHVMA
jgi:hypothetical protein